MYTLEKFYRSCSNAREWYVNVSAKRAQKCCWGLCRTLDLYRLCISTVCSAHLGGPITIRNCTNAEVLQPTNNASPYLQQSPARPPSPPTPPSPSISFPPPQMPPPPPSPFPPTPNSPTSSLASYLDSLSTSEAACERAIIIQAFEFAFSNKANNTTFKLDDASCDLCGKSGVCPTGTETFTSINHIMTDCLSGGAFSATGVAQYCQTKKSAGFIATVVILPLFVVFVAIGLTYYMKTRQSKQGHKTAIGVPVESSAPLSSDSHHAAAQQGKKEEDVWSFLAYS